MKERKGIYLHETDMFKEWMKKKGYIAWPLRLIEQEYLYAQFLKEGLAEITPKPKAKLGK